MGREQAISGQAVKCGAVPTARGGYVKVIGLWMRVLEIPGATGGIGVKSKKFSSIL